MQLEKLLCMDEAQGIDYAKLAERGFDTGGKTGFLTGKDVQKALGPPFPVHWRAILYLAPNPGRLSGNDLATLTNHLWSKLIAFEQAGRKHREPDDAIGAIKDLLWAASQSRQIRQSAMVRVALQEYIDPKLCDSCKGSQHKGKIARTVPGIGLVYSTCEDCNGRTWIPWSDRRRQQQCDIRPEQWAKRYERGYHVVYQECTDIHAEAAKAFKQRLFGPAPIEHRLQARA